MGNGHSHKHLRAVDKDDEELETALSTASRNARIRTSFLLPQSLHKFLKDEAARQGGSVTQVILTAISEYRERQVGAGANSWDTVGEVDHYDPSKFYTHSQDNRGHSFHLRLNIPKNLAGALAQLVQSGAVPNYTSMEAVARDGLYHRAKQIAMLVEDGDLEHAVDLAMLVAEEMSIVAREEQAEELVQAIKDNAERMMSRQQYAQVLKYLSDREGVSGSLPEPWKEELEGYMEAMVAKARLRKKN